MAAVLNALAPFVINMIKDMSKEELTMLLGVSVEIKKLGDKVENLEAYLTDAERRRFNEARVQRWVSKLKGALYEATDILELCHLDAEERRNKGRGGCSWASMEDKAPGCLRPLLFCLRKPGFAHGMGGRIKELNARLDGIREEMSEFKFEPSSFQEQTRPSDATPRSRTTTSLMDESAIVGDKIESDTNALVQVLLSNEPAIMVVSIVGPGGMGKTTLAKKIFNDEDVKMNFGSKIWLSVTECYDEEKLLRSAITQVTGAGDVPLASGGDKQVLSQALVGALSSRGNRFLLVLDDVWSNGAWTCVLQSPVVEAALQHPRSRVIITTRNKDIVKDMGATYHRHHVQPMEHEDAWSLLKKQFPPQMDGEWCSLQELGSLSRLRELGIEGLEALVPSGGSLDATKAKLHDKQQLRTLILVWNNPREEEDNSDAARQRVEEVINQLCPPRHLETLVLWNYLGRLGPSWLTAAVVDLSSLKLLDMNALPFCTQLPDGLCQLHSLEVLMIDFAPSIRRVGPEFVQRRQTSLGMMSFPRLQFLKFKGLPNWEEWVWEKDEAKDDIAMPSLHLLQIIDCNKLYRLPTGLASSKRIALRELVLDRAVRITAVENFPSVETLFVWNCPSLKIIRGFPRLQFASIQLCPALEVLEDVTEKLDSMELVDPAMVTFPEYLRGLKVRRLSVCCHQRLHDLFIFGSTDNNPSSDYLAEAEKVKHCGQVKVFPAPSQYADIERQQALQVIPSTNTMFTSMHRGISLDFNEGLGSAMSDYRSYQQ